MKITLISHSSVLIETPGASIWCDPWLAGKAFGDSWALLDEPAGVETAIETATHVWISHEHPDHFHISTLKGLPTDFKNRVTLLFQDDGMTKMPDAFRSLGFQNIQLMPHREFVQVGNSKVYCYQQGPMNSALSLVHEETCVLNLNDCELTPTDVKLLIQDLPEITTLLTQFSIAGYGGAGSLDDQAQQVLHNVALDHARLGAANTIPFASFVYFCRADNEFINSHANTIEDVVNMAADRQVELVVLKNGQTFDTDEEQAHDNTLARDHWRSIFDCLASREIDELCPVPVEQIAEAVFHRSAQLKSMYPNLVLRWLGPVVVEVPDLQMTVLIDCGLGTAMPTELPANIQMHSEALLIAFKSPFGIQTVGVGGRYKVISEPKRWRRYRILSSMNNAGIPLRLGKLLKKEFFVASSGRLRGSLAQARGQLARTK